jgi:hypothetical protein
MGRCIIVINSISSSGANIIIDNKNQKSSDNQVKILQHQEMAVQKQIESIKQNDKMDIKTKQELIKPLESQIQSIESQIQQVQMDAMGKKNDISDSSNKRQISSSTSSEELENKIEVSKNMLFISMSGIYKQTRSLNSIRKGFNNQANILNSDADFDEMTRNYNGAKRKRAEAASDVGRANAMQSKIGKVNNDIKKSEKNINDLNEKKETLKIDNTENQVKNIDKFA